MFREKWEKSAGFQTDFFAKCLGCISWHQKTDGLSTVTVSQWKHFQVLQVWSCSSKSQKAWQQDQEGAKNQEAEQIKQDLQLLTITITSHDAKNWHKVWGCCVLSWVLWNKTWVKGIKDKTHASLECCYDVARTFPESAPFLCWDIQKERNKIESRIPTERKENIAMISPVTCPLFLNCGFLWKCLLLWFHVSPPLHLPFSLSKLLKRVIFPQNPPEKIWNNEPALKASKILLINL